MHLDLVHLHPTIAIHRNQDGEDPFARDSEAAHACGTLYSHGGSPSNQRTRGFRPQRPAGKGGANASQLRQYAEATLGGGSLKKIVKLPEGEDENEWLAVNSKRVCILGALVANGNSGGFLQPHQPSLWIDHRILLSAILS